MRRLIWVVLVVGAAGCANAGDEPFGTEEQEAARSCALVRCFAAPQCAEGQHIIYTPNDCCGRCVGPNQSSPRCAGVLCAAVACGAGEQRVYHPGTCCGVCVPVPPESCGISVCGGDEYCCNESCGICAPLDGGFCTEQLCGEPL